MATRAAARTLRSSRQLLSDLLHRSSREHRSPDLPRCYPNPILLLRTLLLCGTSSITARQRTCLVAKHVLRAPRRARSGQRAHCGRFAQGLIPLVNHNATSQLGELTHHRDCPRLRQTRTAHALTQVITQIQTRPTQYQTTSTQYPAPPALGACSVLNTDRGVPPSVTPPPVLSAEATRRIAYIAQHPPDSAVPATRVLVRPSFISITSGAIQIVHHEAARTSAVVTLGGPDIDAQLPRNCSRSRRGARIKGGVRLLRCSCSSSGVVPW